MVFARVSCIAAWSAVWTDRRVRPNEHLVVIQFLIKIQAVGALHCICGEPARELAMVFGINGGDVRMWISTDARGSCFVSALLCLRRLLGFRRRVYFPMLVPRQLDHGPTRRIKMAPLATGSGGLGLSAWRLEYCTAPGVAER